MKMTWYIKVKSTYQFVIFMKIKYILDFRKNKSKHIFLPEQNNLKIILKSMMNENIII